MASQPATTHTIQDTTTAIERALEELDQMIHRSKALLQRVHKPEAIEERLRAWEGIRGLWKDRMVGDAVEYQRKMRDEFEEHSEI